MLGGSTGKGTKVLAKLTGGTELVPKDSIGANDTLVLIGCEGTTVEVDCTCTKVFMQSCKDVRLVLRGKIITHTVECFKSDGCTLEFECKVFTAQLDLCTVRRPPGLKLNIPPRLFLYGAGVLTLSSGGRIAVRPPGLKLNIPPQLFLYGAGVLTLSSGGNQGLSVNWAKRENFQTVISAGCHSTQINLLDLPAGGSRLTAATPHGGSLLRL